MKTLFYNSLLRIVGGGCYCIPEVVIDDIRFISTSVTVYAEDIISCKAACCGGYSRYVSGFCWNGTNGNCTDITKQMQDWYFSAHMKRFVK